MNLAQCWDRPGKILNTERICNNTDSTLNDSHLEIEMTTFPSKLIPSHSLVLYQLQQCKDHIEIIVVRNLKKLREFFSKVDLCAKSRRGARERPTSTGELPLEAKGAPSSSPSLLLSTAMICASCLQVYVKSLHCSNLTLIMSTPPRSSSMATFFTGMGLPSSPIGLLMHYIDYMVNSVGLVRSKLHNINFLDVTLSLISRKPRKRMFSIQISLLIVTFSSHISWVLTLI